jgi:hypothetical protein
LQTLMDVVAGVYEVVTLSGSTYVLDLDLSIIFRRPKASSDHERRLRRDGELHKLLEILECTVGRNMVLLIDLEVEEADYTTRTTNLVVSIEEVGE